MNASKTNSKATIPMLEICTIHNKRNSSGTPTVNFFIFYCFTVYFDICSVKSPTNALLLIQRTHLILH